MQAVVDKTTNIVTFVFPEDIEIILTDKSMFAGGMRALDVNSSTHLVASVDDNDLFVGGLWTWTVDDGWACYDQAKLLEEIGPRIYNEVQVLIQEMLDSKAREFEYDGIHSACGWAGVIEDATALKMWGAACWNTSKQIKTEVLSGERPILTAVAVMAEMPLFSDYFSEPAS